MKPVEGYECKVHICVCTNERTDGRTACADFGGKEFFSTLKARVKSEGLSASYWVTRTGCLGFCNNVGTTVAIHKQGESSEWLSEVTAEDTEKVWQKIRSA